MIISFTLVKYGILVVHPYQLNEWTNNTLLNNSLQVWVWRKATLHLNMNPCNESQFIKAVSSSYLLSQRTGLAITVKMSFLAFTRTDSSVATVLSLCARSAFRWKQQRPVRCVTSTSQPGRITGCQKPQSCSSASDIWSESTWTSTPDTHPPWSTAGPTGSAHTHTHTLHF